jgi:hypothetical protein
MFILVKNESNTLILAFLTLYLASEFSFKNCASLHKNLLPKFYVQLPDRFHEECDDDGPMERAKVC